jgi:hypothetical protein
MANDPIKDLQLKQEVMITSASGTNHIDSVRRQNGRLLALCGFSVDPDEGPFQTLRDCVFCEKEAADAKQKAAAAEAARQLREGFRVVREPVELGAEPDLQPEKSS